MGFIKMALKNIGFTANIDATVRNDLIYEGITTYLPLAVDFIRLFKLCSK